MAQILHRNTNRGSISLDHWADQRESRKMHFQAVNRGSCPDSLDEIETRVTEQRYSSSVQLQSDHDLKNLQELAPKTCCYTTAGTDLAKQGRDPLQSTPVLSEKVQRLHLHN